MARKNKPYFLALWNKIRISKMKVGCKNIRTDGVLMFGYNTRLVFQPLAKIHLGKNVVSDGRLVIIVDKNAKLHIGDNVYFNENMMISCKAAISVGTGCKFGPNISIFDNDHKYNSKNGVSGQHIAEPISIGENSWIGANCVILKGSQIGKNCVIGAGTVVKGIIPDGMLVTNGGELKMRPIDEDK